MSWNMIEKIMIRNGRIRPSILLFDNQMTSPGLSLGLCLARSWHFPFLNVSFKSTMRKSLGQTSVMLQDGLNIQEFPSIVGKGMGLVPMHNLTSSRSDRSSAINLPNNLKESPAETNMVFERLNHCFSVKEVLHLLASIPEKEKTPKVALQTLKKIIEIENNHHRNQGISNCEVKDLPYCFSRTATVNELVDSIAGSSDTHLLFEGLKAVNQDSCSGSETSYKQKLCDEVFSQATDGKFSILQICEIVKVFSNMKNDLKIGDEIDKLWVGIVDKDEEITENNITDLFRILPMFEQSRYMLLKILEKRILNVWWRLSARTIADAMVVLFEVKCTPQRVLNLFSRWTNINIHLISEDEVVAIVRGFSALEYMDNGIVSSIERYVKSKAVNVKSPHVLAAIMDYCAQFRIRSLHVMQGCGEYFIEHGATLPPIFIKSFFVPFGLLDYPPPNGIKFWKVLETVMDKKFIQFRPEDALDLMLSCVYLEKHPVNFIKKIFNPYFLDRLHSTTDQNVLQLMRTKLKLFDTAMTLECTNYRGPLLPKDHSAKSLWQDGRVKRMVNNILEPLSRIAGGTDLLTTSVVLGQLPTMGLYVVDILLHPKGMGSALLQFNFQRDPNVFMAILIHIPEHYCSEGKYLMGPQVMRKRHLRKLGLKVASLEYSQLAKLKVHPQTLESYLVQKIRTAERAL